jgi:hypothetical protein
MSRWGHSRTFATPLRHVWDAPMNRHSAPSVGKVAVNGPSFNRRGTATSCQKPTWAKFTIERLSLSGLLLEPLDEDFHGAP